jgi:nephrocystin-3
MERTELRVFLSSTFADLQPEREQLVKKVFPRIRAKCRDRGVEFTEIDLRWGITSEESRTGKVVRVCLEEIDKCQPYFIGILGSRYGWRPGIDEVQKDDQLLSQFPWLAEYADSNKSIIEMELAHGVFHRNKNESAFVYEQISHLSEIADADREPFDELKSKLREQAAGYRTFNTPEELGEAVYADLLFLLDRDWPESKERTPLETERAAHHAFALNRTRSYVANPDDYERFEKFVESDDPPLVVWGISGLGKSALMAYLAHEYAVRHPGSFLVAHFIGATSGTSEAALVLRRVMEEIKARYQLPDEIPADEAKFVDEFPSWLAKARSDDKMILLLDAVNQLSGIGPEMHWLPEFIPANVRLVVSTVPAIPLEELRKRDHTELALAPLTAEARERITVEFLTRYHKMLDDGQLKLIASETKLERPLFLRTLLEEIRIFGHYSSLSVHIADYLSSTDERDLFQHVLARMERDFGAATVRAVMMALWAARYGLVETELLEVTGLPRLVISEFLIALEFHLMQRGGLFTFFHNYLREAVERRYLASNEAKILAHRHLADYFAKQPFDARRRDEEPWQWQQAGELNALQSCLMQPSMVAMFANEHQAYEAFGYWRALPAIEFDVPYLTRLEGEQIQTNFAAYRNIISLFITAGDYDKAANFLDEGYPLFDARTDEVRLLEVQVIRAELETYRGAFAAAIERANELLRVHEEQLERVHVFKSKLQDLLSVSYYSLGQFAKAEEIARDKIVYSEALHGATNYETVLGYKNLAAILIADQRLEEGLKICEQAVRGCIQIFGDPHPETAMCRMNLAVCLTYQQSFERSIVEFATAELALRSSLGANHPETLNCQLNIANLHVELRQTEAAREIAIRLNAQYLKLTGADGFMSATTGILIGYTYFLERKFLEAQDYYARYTPVLQKLQGENHPSVQKFRSRIREIERAIAQPTD